jgi:hypothetical protein
MLHGTNVEKISILIGTLEQKHTYVLQCVLSERSVPL